MAEPTPPPSYSSRPPALPSTADANPYVPVSWMAVAGAGVAALFVLTLLVLGYGAYRSKRPLIAPEILILPAVSLVLCFVAWRMIRNSEGTRTGELFGISLPRAAAWVSIIFFLGYFTYLTAIDFSIRRDAEAEVTKWIELVRKADDASAPDPLDVAFLRTLDPANRGTYTRINDRGEMRKRLQDRYRDEHVAFRQSDLILLAERNRENSSFESGGLRDWIYKETGVECVFTGTYKCPEGVFPVLIPLKSIEAGTAAEGVVGRQWQVVPTQGGFIQRDRAAMTPYGWMLMSLIRSGSEYSHDLLRLSALGPGMRPYIYQCFIKGNDQPRIWCRYLMIEPRAGNTELDIPRGPWFEVFTTMSATVAVGGTPVVAQPFNSDYQTYLQQQFLRYPGGGEPSPAVRDKFLKCWTEEPRGIVPSGGAIPSSPDMYPSITWTSSAIQVRFPMEIPFTDGTAARGRMVAECTDPAVIAELQSLRQSADPNRTSNTDPHERGYRPVNWKFIRIESDMTPIRPLGPGDRPGAGPPR